MEFLKKEEKRSLTLTGSFFICLVKFLLHIILTNIFRTTLDIVFITAQRQK